MIIKAGGKKRVLLINTFSIQHFHGGAEVFVEELKRLFQDVGVGVNLLTFPGEKWLSGVLGRNRLGFLGKLWVLFLEVFGRVRNRRLLNALNCDQYDVAVVNNWRGFGCSIVGELRKRFRGKIVLVIHDYALLCNRNTLFSKQASRPCIHRCWGCKLIRYNWREAVDSVDQIVFPSVSCRDTFEIKSGVTGMRRKSRIVYHEVSDSLRINAAIKREVGGEAKIRVGFLGQLELHKGINKVLELANLNSNGEYEIFVAGKGSMESDIRYATGLRYLGFLSSAEERSRFLASLDVLFVPSLWPEVFGLVTAEALKAGLIIAGFEYGATREIAGNRFMLLSPTRIDWFHQWLSNRQSVRRRIAQLNARMNQDSSKVNQMTSFYTSLLDETT